MARTTSGVNAWNLRHGKVLRMINFTFGGVYTMTKSIYQSVPVSARGVINSAHALLNEIYALGLQEKRLELFGSKTGDHPRL